MKPLKVALAVACAVVVGWAFTAVADIPASAYVQRGLINHWDGVDNAGTGTHDPASTVWKDLKGGLDMTLANKATWATNGNSLVVSGCCAAKADSATSAYRTIEVVYRMTAASGRILFASGCETGGNRRFVLFDASGTQMYADGGGATLAVPTSVDADAIRSFSAIYAEDNSVATLVTNGVVLASPVNLSNGWNIGDRKAMVGSRNATGTSYGWTGRVYAIRLYSCELTPEELAENARLDKLRFFDVPEGKVGVQVVNGAADIPAVVPNPAAGIQTYDPGVSQTFDSGVPAVGEVVYSEDRLLRKTFLGYSIDGGATVASADVTLTVDANYALEWKYAAERATAAQADRAGCRVSDGTVTAAAVTNWDAVATANAYAFTAVPGDGFTFAGWDCPALAGQLDLSRPTVTVPAGCGHLLVARFIAATDADASSYVQDGLITHLDAIRNVGLFRPHDNAATKWIDLSPSHNDLTLTASGSWKDAALSCNGASYGAWRSGFALGDICTIEVVFRIMKNGSGFVFTPGAGTSTKECVFNGTGSRAGILQFCGGSGQKTLNLGSNPDEFLGKLIQASSVYQSPTEVNVLRLCQNGATPDNVKTDGDGWGQGSSFCVGGRSGGNGSYPLAVDVSAIRIYNRQLTPAEVARNYVVDQKRYGGTELPERRLFSVWGEPANYGTPSPDYGDTVYGDDTQVTCSVADILETYELDGVRAFRVDGGTRAVFRGYEAVTYTTKVTGEDETIVRDIAPGVDSVTWKWQRQYLVHASSANAGCTVSVDGSTAGASCDKWTDENASVTIVATPGEGYAFKNWTGVALDAETAANPTLTLTMDAAKSVSALFKETAHVPTDVIGTGLDGDWTDGSMWDGGNVPGKGDRVTVMGGTLTLKGETEHLESLILDGATLVMDEGALNAVTDLKTRIVANRVDLRNGARITHVANTMQVDEWKGIGEWRMNGRVHIICTDLSIDAMSSIDASERGYAKLANRDGAPGPGGTLGPSGGAYGGAYGGCGYGEHITVGETKYQPDDWEHNVAYGDRAAPVWCGSGGGAALAKAGCAGGGAIRIEASGRVTVEGAIRADAAVQTPNSNYGAGSGGGIWIDCSTIAGGGILSARGGKGTASGGQEYGSGGGGRIAVNYDAAQENELGTPALRFDVGAPASSAAVRTLACVGTLQFTDDRFLKDTFGGDGATGVLNGQVFCDSWTFWHPTKLALDNAWIRLGDPKMPALVLSGDVTVTGAGGRLDLGGDEAFSCGRFANEAPYVRYGSTKMPSLRAANLTLADGGMLATYPAPTNGTDGARLELALTGAVTVGAGCLVHPHCHPTNGAVTRITAATADVAGRIDAQGAGFATYYRTALGPGRGKSSSRGGGYGGPASSYSYAEESGWTYGDLRAPVFPGSSGGPGGNSATLGYGGTSGGGLVWIEVSEEFRLDGTVTSKAQHGNFGSGTAYGSGGGIYLTARTFVGTGSLDASNDGLQVSSQQGGGGRIALVYDTAAQAAVEAQPTFKLDAMSYPATSGSVTAKIRAGDHDMGTIYLSDARFLTSVFTKATVPGGEIHCGDWSAYRPDSLYVSQSRVRLATDGAALEIGGDVTITNRASIGFGGGTHAMSNCMARLAMTDGPGACIRVRGNVVLHDGVDTGYASTGEGYNWDTSLFLLAGESVVGERDATVGLVLQVDGDFVLASAKTSCRFHPNAASGAAPVLRARNVRQVEGAIFDAVGTGYSGDATGVKGAGPGGAGPGLAGGGHGGAGASYGGTAGVEYGRARRPYVAGSGGCGNGSNNKTSLAGSGGGVIRIEARNRMELAGAVTADGGQPTANYLGSGAGGSVCLSCDEWAPEETLTISANGGAAYNSYGGGGGGRVAVLRISDLDARKGDTTVNARGYVTRGYVSVDPALGTATPTTAGECGTIYWGAPVGGLLLFVR